MTILETPETTTFSTGITTLGNLEVQYQTNRPCVLLFQHDLVEPRNRCRTNNVLQIELRGLHVG